MDLQIIRSRIFEIRGYRVMLDFDLVELYETETKILKQVVRRNIDHFPSPDFMFVLTLDNKIIYFCTFKNRFYKFKYRLL